MRLGVERRSTPIEEGEGAPLSVFTHKRDSRGDRDWTGCRAPSFDGGSWLMFRGAAEPFRDAPLEFSPL